jgi:hypothetical protein
MSSRRNSCFNFNSFQFFKVYFLKQLILETTATIPSEYVATWTLTIKFSKIIVIFQSFSIETPFYIPGIKWNESFWTIYFVSRTTVTILVFFKYFI